MAARPLKGATGKSPAPHPSLPNTGLSNQEDHYDISGGKAQATPTRSAIANSANRSGRGMKASQPKQILSGGTEEDLETS